MQGRAICARCRNPLPEEFPIGEISKGICDECAEQLLHYDAVPLQQLIETLPVPIMAVNDDAVVLTANRTATELLGKELSEIQQQRGGNVMECNYAWLPEGCGRTVHCTGCTIRQTVMSTHEDGISRYRVEAYYDMRSENGPVRMKTFVSTEKVGDVVLLRIDDMEAA